MSKLISRLNGFFKTAGVYFSLLCVVLGLLLLALPHKLYMLAKNKSRKNAVNGGTDNE